MANGFTLTANLNVATPNLGAVIQQIQRGLQGVNANVNLNIGANTGRQLTQVNSQLANVGRQARSTGLDFEKFGASAAQSLQRFAGFTAIASTFYTLSRAIKSSIGDAIDFQHELVKISQVTGTSLKDLSKLTSEVTQLSVEFGVNSNKLLAVAQTFAQAGLSTEKLTKALKAIAKSDVSPTFDNMADTAEGTIAILAQFGVEVDDLESTLGSLNSVAAKFAVESGDIITAVRRTGGAFEAAGGSLQEFIALFTSVRATTRESAESIATGFRTIFTRIQRTRTIGFLDDLGIELRDFEGKFVGPYKAIERLSNALKDLPSTDPRFSQIIEELGGFRQVSKVIPLIKEFGTAQQALQVAQRDSNSLTKDAATSQQSLLIRITKVKEEFQDLIRTVSNSTSFKNFADVALKLASAFIQVAKSLEPLIPLIAGLGATKLGIAGVRTAGSFKKTLGFNKGGLVPGSGNGDTVPAMLEPGEFVIRKNAVNAIGAGNLQGMNAQRANSGGQIVKRFATSGNVTKGQVRALSISDNPEAKKLYNDLQVKYLNDPAISQASKDEYNRSESSRAGKLLRAYGNDIEKFYNPTGGTRAENKALEDANRKAVADENSALADSLISKNDRVFGGIYLTPGGIREPYGESTSITANGKSVPIPYTILNVSPPAKTSENVIDNTLIPGVTNVIKQSAAEMGSFFGATPSKDIRITNKEGVFGSLFEAGLLSLGGPLSSSNDDSRRFDFGRGLKQLSNKFGDYGITLENRPTDAKFEFNDNSKADIRKKVKSYYQESADASLLRRASGGNTPNNGTDTVPALLTPGEFVINKDAARSIGLGGLHQLNRADKVQKFAKGGAVQGFAGGGLVNGVGAALAILPLITSIGGLTNSNNKLADAVSSAAAQFLTFKFLISQAKDLFSGYFPSLGTRLESSRTNRASLITERNTSIANKDVLVSANKVSTQKLNKGKLKQEQLEIERFLLDNDIANGVNVPASTKALGKNLKQQSQLQPRIATQEQLVSEQYRAIAANNQATSAITTRIRAENRMIRTLERHNTAVSTAETLTIALGAALLATGQYLEQTGQAQIKAGDISGGKDNIISGSRLSGAGQGAAIGSGAIGLGASIGTAVNPGIGTAIGALIGTAITIGASIAGSEFGAKAGKKIAEQLEREVKFDQAIKPFTTSIETVLSGKATASSARLKVAAGTDVLRRNLLGTTVEGKETAKGRIDSAGLQISQFLEKLATESDSIEEFTQKAGASLINFAEFQAKSVTEVTQTYADLIKAQNKAKETQNNLAIAQERQLVRLREFNNLSSAVKDAILALDTFAVSLDSLEAFSSGGSGSSKFVDRSEVFSRIGNVSNLGQFQNIVQQVNSGLGSESNELTSELLATNASLQQLPNIIAQVVAESPNDSDALQLRFDNALDNANIPKFVQQVLQANLGALLGPDQKSEKFFSDVRNNPSGVSDKLVDGAFKPLVDFFSEQAKLLNDHNNKIANIFEKQRAIELKKLDLAQKVINNNEAKEEFNAGINNTQFTLADARRNEATRRGSFGVNPNLNATDAGAAITRKQQDITQKERELQTTTEAGARDALLQTLANERNEVDKLTNYLNYLGDAAQRNTGLLKAQAAASQERSLRKNISEEFVFGGPDARRGLITGAAGAAQLAQTNDLNSVPAFAQGQTFDFLKRLGDVKLGILGGDSGEDVIKKTITKFLTSQGIAQNDAEQLAGLQVAGPEKLIVDAVNANFTEANKVAEAQRKILENIEIGLQAQRDAATKGFEIEKQNNKNDNKRKELGLEVGSLTAQQTDVQGRFQTLNSIKSLIPNVTDDRAFNVIKNIDSFKDIKEREDKLKKQKSIDSVLSAASVDRIKNTDTSIKGTLLGLTDGGATGTVDSILKDLTGVNRKFLTGRDKFNQSQLTESDLLSLNTDLVNNLGADTARVITNALTNAGNINETSGLDFETIFNTLKPTLEILSKQRNTDVLKLNSDKQELGQKTGLTVDDIDIVLFHSKELAELNVKLGETTLANIQGFNTTLDGLRATIQTKIDEIAKIPANQAGGVPLQKAKGGRIPGVGTRDNVPVLATPGEFMMRREAVNAIGLDELQRMNGMRRGGPARLTPEQKRAAYLASQKAKRDKFKASSPQAKASDKFATVDAVYGTDTSPSGKRLSKGYFNNEKNKSSLRRDKESAQIRNLTEEEKYNALYGDINGLSDLQLKYRERDIKNNNIKEANARYTPSANRRQFYGKTHRLNDGNVDKYLADFVETEKTRETLKANPNKGFELNQIQPDGSERNYKKDYKTGKVTSGDLTFRPGQSTYDASKFGKAPSQFKEIPFDKFKPKTVEFQSEIDKRKVAELEQAKNASANVIGQGIQGLFGAGKVGESALDDYNKHYENRLVADALRGGLNEFSVDHIHSSVFTDDDRKYMSDRYKSLKKFPLTRKGEWESDEELAKAKDNPYDFAYDKDKGVVATAREMVRKYDEKKKTNILGGVGANIIGQGIQGFFGTANSISGDNIKQITAKQKVEADMAAYSKKRTADEIMRGRIQQTPLGKGFLSIGEENILNAQKASRDIGAVNKKYEEERAKNEFFNKFNKNKFADGGFVPGQGNADTIPAMLMPGEFVMNKGAVETIGVDKLARANRVGRKNGSTSIEGMSNGGVLTINPEISQVFSKFDVSVAKLATAIEAMPHTINMSVRHTVEVIFNGAEVLASLQPGIQDLVVKTTQKSINTMIAAKFPDVGSMQYG